MKTMMNAAEVVGVISVGMCSTHKLAEAGCATCERKLAAIAAVRALDERLSNLLLLASAVRKAREAHVEAQAAHYRVTRIARRSTTAFPKYREATLALNDAHTTLAVARSALEEALDAITSPPESESLLRDGERA